MLGGGIVSVQSTVSAVTIPDMARRTVLYYTTGL